MNRLDMKSWWWLVFAVPVLLLSSCKDSAVRSLSDLKKDQRKAIEQLIADSGFRVSEVKSNELPSQIDKGVYYHLENGLYLRVLNKGTETDGKLERAVVGQTKIHVTFEGHVFSRSNPVIIRPNNLSNPGVEAIEFLYIKDYQAGDIHYSTIPVNKNNIPNLDNLMCEGLAFPMTQLGNRAKVSLIVPFELGPQNTYTNGYSLFVKEATYQFKKK